MDEETNSIAVIVKHMAGNMRSRWTDFLTSDGEKPGRDRDAEFSDPPATREALLQLWEEGWQCLLGTLESLSDADLGRTITIRGEAHSVMQAINRQVAHYPYHCGQIVFLAKHLCAGPLADFECAARPISGVQPSRSRWRGEPPLSEFPAGSIREWGRACARRWPAPRLSRR